MNIHSPVSNAVTSDKREAILEAALGLFVERGFHGTAVPLIAEKAEVGTGTIYRYFESKEAIVNALYQQWKSRMATLISNDLPLGRPARELFTAFWKRMMAFATENPTAIAFLELNHHAAYLDEASRALEERSLAMGRMLLGEMRRMQVVKDLPAELLIAIMQGIFVSLVRYSREGCLTLTPELVDAAEGCAWEAIRR